MQIILASRSPRRLMLLQSAGLRVEVQPTHIDETLTSQENIDDAVQRLSLEKANACLHRGAHPIIAADTLVSIDGQPLGQPEDLNAAKTMLLQLSGRSHHVLTGVTVRIHTATLTRLVSTSVTFRSISEREIDNYLMHNDVLDKAGAYAIQGGAACFIEAIKGPLDNVIGLPVHTTLNMVDELTSTAGASQ